jgi:hypothetical protein
MENEKDDIKLIKNDIEHEKRNNINNFKQKIAPKIKKAAPLLIIGALCFILGIGTGRAFEKNNNRISNAAMMEGNFPGGFNNGQQNGGQSNRQRPQGNTQNGNQYSNGQGNNQNNNGTTTPRGGRMNGGTNQQNGSQTPNSNTQNQNGSSN